LGRFNTQDTKRHPLATVLD